MSDAGVAYVQLLPSMKGFSQAVTRELKGALQKPAEDAGRDAGGAAGDGIADGVNGKKGRLASAAESAGNVFKVGLAAAGAAAGALLAAGFAGAVENERLTDKLEAQFGGGEFGASMGDIAGRLYADAFGDSVADTGAALRAVWQNGLVAEDVTDAELEALTAKVLTFTDVMDQDLDMTTQAVSNMLRNGLAANAEEALDILTTGIQQGADKAGDLAETFNEYGTEFRELGLSGAEATGLMLQGIKGGARDADYVADALKELAIRAKDGSATTAEGFAAIGLSAEAMTAAFSEGGPAARDALGQVLNGLQGIEDPAARDAAAVALFGTKAEDLQDALYELDLDTAAAGMGNVEGSTADLADAYDNAATKLESFKRKGLQKLVEFIGGTVIPKVEALIAAVGPPLQAAFSAASAAIDDIDWSALTDAWDAFVSGFSGDTDGPDLSGWLATIQTLGTTIESVWSGAVRPFVEFIVGNQEALVGALAAIGATIAVLLVPALWGLVSPILAAIAPFLLIAGLVAAVGYGLVWLYQNVESFRTVVEESLPLIQQLFTSALTIITTLVTWAVAVVGWLWSTFGQDLVDIIVAVWDTIVGVFTGALNVVVGLFNLVAAILTGDWSGAWEAIKQITSGALQVVWSLISGGMRIIWNVIQIAWTVIKSIFTGGWNAVKSIVTGGINAVKGFFGRLPGLLSSALSTVASVLTSPFRSAFSAIKDLWNSTVGGFGFSVPSWIPGVGGKGFNIPTMHTGGIFRSPFGTDEGLALLQDGEAVLTADDQAALGNTPPAGNVRVVIGADGDREFLRWLRSTVRIEGGGDVQLALGQ